MSANWILIDADLGTYSSTKFKSGGRLYFIKVGRKNVSVYLNTAYEDRLLSKCPNTFKSILKDFRGYTQKTKNEKDILDTLKIKAKINYKNVWHKEYKMVY